MGNYDNCNPEVSLGCTGMRKSSVQKLISEKTEVCLVPQDHL